MLPVSQVPPAAATAPQVARWCCSDPESQKQSTFDGVRTGLGRVRTLMPVCMCDCICLRPSFPLNTTHFLPTTTPHSHRFDFCSRLTCGTCTAGEVHSELRANFVGRKNNLRHHQSSPLLTIDYLGALSASFLHRKALYKIPPRLQFPQSTRQQRRSTELRENNNNKIKQGKKEDSETKKEEQKKRRETRKNNLEVLTQFFIPYPEFSVTATSITKHVGIGIQLRLQWTAAALSTTAARVSSICSTPSTVSQIFGGYIHKYLCTYVAVGFLSFIANHLDTRRQYTQYQQPPQAPPAAQNYPPQYTQTPSTYPGYPTTAVLLNSIYFISIYSCSVLITNISNHSSTTQVVTESHQYQPSLTLLLSTLVSVFEPLPIKIGLIVSIDGHFPPPQASAFSQHHASSHPYTGKKKALLIGINYFNQKGQLRGCVNDVKNMSSFLIDRYGYKREDMVILTDDQQNPRSIPTKQNILQAMHWLVKDAKPGDSLFFHYSG